jgi:tRNA threonylcarbamoyladenosine biosynthesis protein TsaE
MMNERSFQYQLSAIEALMPRVAEALAGRRKIALYGEMGAGKTTFTASFCRHFGVTQAVTSPTFSLINEYAFRQPDGRETLIRHLDLYRLKNLGEALDIGVEDLLYDQHYCIIEWPQLLEPMFPGDMAKIYIEFVDANTRNCLILP